jgi:adenylylsulfate kinase
MKSSNTKWHEGCISSKDRQQLLQQKSVLIWFTGLSGSGKSTLAYALEAKLFQRHHLCYVLDGDNIRHGINGDLGFSATDRQENIRRVREIAKLFVDAGLITISSFISPYRQDRDLLRQILPKGKFIEVFVKCSLETCEKRDAKGLYRKARANQIQDFTGISAPYEAPLEPEIVIDTDKLSVKECVKKLLEHLQAENIIQKDN